MLCMKKLSCSFYNWTRYRNENFYKDLDCVLFSDTRIFWSLILSNSDKQVLWMQILLIVILEKLGLGKFVFIFKSYWRQHLWLLMIWYYYWVPNVKEMPLTKFQRSQSIWIVFTAFYPHVGKFRSFLHHWCHKKALNSRISIFWHIQGHLGAKYWPIARKKDKLFLSHVCIITLLALFQIFTVRPNIHDPLSD